MKNYKLSNGIRVIYEYSPINVTSFCIGFNAGAAVEGENEYGLAHAVEHMIFKGTSKRSEQDINNKFDELFGFNNAMTNFPYCIYYGTTLSEDFEKGFELYSDIIVNPSFPMEGFKEELSVIIEELKEWKDDNFQLCEDELLKNAFKLRRIRECIIGRAETINNFTIEQIRDFYHKFYYGNNCVISVVTGLEAEAVLNIIEKYMHGLKSDGVKILDVSYEKNAAGIFTKTKAGIEGAKIQYCFRVDSLNDEEIKALKLFNYKFGEGTSSILYDEIRTKYGLAYDVFSQIKRETGIKLFTICMGTSKDNIYKAIDIVNNKLMDIQSFESYFTEDQIEKAVKSIKLKRELALEKSIVRSNTLTANEIMYNNSDLIGDIIGIEITSKEAVMKVVKKIIKETTIQILEP